MARRALFLIVAVATIGVASNALWGAWSVELPANAAAVPGGVCDQDCLPNGTTCQTPDPCNVENVGSYCQYCPDATTGEYCQSTPTAEDGCLFDYSHTCSGTVQGACHYGFGRYYCHSGYEWGTPSLGTPCSGWLYQCHEA